MMKLVSTQLTDSLEAPSAAFICGRATLAIVASRNWQTETRITPSQQQAACSGFPAAACLGRRLLARAGTRYLLVSIADMGRKPGDQAAAMACRSMAMRTGTRWVTFTQLPLAFCAGSTENSEPVPAPMLATWPVSLQSG